MLCSRKLTEHCKPAIMKKVKMAILKVNKNKNKLDKRALENIRLNTI